VERTAVLVHLVDGTQDDVAGAYNTVRRELAAYGAGLAEKPEIVALNKADALDPKTRKSAAAALKKAAGKTPFVASGFSGEGVKELLRAAFAEVRARRARQRIEETAGEDLAQEWRP